MKPPVHVAFERWAGERRDTTIVDFLSRCDHGTYSELNFAKSGKVPVFPKSRRIQLKINKPSLRLDPTIALRGASGIPSTREGVVKLASSSSSTTASPPTNGGSDAGRCIRRKFHRPPPSCIAPRRPRSIAVEPTQTPPNPPSRSAPTASTTVPTLAPTTLATATPVTFLRSIVSAENLPHHLVFTTLALLLASGFIVRRIHSKDRYKAPATTAPKGTKKRKQDVVKSIRIAQAQDDRASTTAGGVKSRSSTTTTPSTTLLPSASCITSTSAAIRSNLEKISAVLKPLRRDVSRDGVTKKSEVTQSTSGTLHGGKSDGFQLGKDGGSQKKGKAKKGKGVATIATSSGNKGSGSDMSRTSSKQGSKDVGGETRKTDQGVQVSQRDVEPSPLNTDQVTPTSTNGFEVWRENHTLPSADPSKPAPSSSSDPPPTATASVQTSPRLLPYRPRSPVSSSSPERVVAISSPAPTRPVAVPITFDLHASFQATPSSRTSEDDPPSISPSLSSTPSRSPSLSTSASSGSPTGRRPSSSSTPVLAGNGSRSRKQARKSGPSGPNGKAIVGLPKPVEKDEDDGNAGTERENGDLRSEANRLNSTKNRLNGRDRPAPIPIPSNSVRAISNDSTPQPQRRLSTASSSAYSTSNMSLTSSGSPYSAERVLPSMPPAMTMTPPDFARRSSSTTSYDRDETLRWTSSTSTNGRGREASLRGLGVDLESEDGSVEGGDGKSRTGESVRGSSPRPPSRGYFQPQLGRTVSSTNAFATPDSSPHPAPRTISQFGTPSPSYPPPNQPWSPHSSSSASQNASLVPYPIASSSSNNAGPNASRPPSRQSSLSVPLNPSQQQQLHLQQQQHGYAIAQVQAQASAQYQHVIALQYQAQLQHQHQQQQQHQREDPRQRRRAGDGGSGPEDAGSQLANGLVYPVSSTNPSQAHAQSPVHWPLGSSHPASPMATNYPPHLSHAVSPTSANFAQHNSISAHTQAQMYQSYINQSAAYYLATSGSSPHASPNHPQQHPTRPRINSSVSAVAVLGGGSASNRNGSVSSPISTSSLASPRLNGPEKQRQGSTNPSASSMFSPLGAGAGGGGSTNDASAWKARAKEAEMEADRNAKELEIARWRLSVLEGEQLANEVENQEALRALATRAMRAEARIKLLEETRKLESQPSPATNAVDSSPSPSPAAASPVAPKPMDLPPTTETSWRAFGEGESSNGGPGSGLHPLSWLDLDSISFGTRPLNSSSSMSRPPLTSSYSSHRKRAGRNSQGGNGNGRRQSGNHQNGRRKSGNNNNHNGHPLSPSLHLSVPSTDVIDPIESGLPSPVGDTKEEEEDEEDIVIVLNAPKRSAPSRRSSYALSIGGGGGEDRSLSVASGVGLGAAEDGSSFIDEDDIPAIDFDSDPTTSRRLLSLPDLIHPSHQRQGNSSSESQNGSVYGGEDGEEDDEVDYVGFLPGFLIASKATRDGSGSRRGGADGPNGRIEEDVNENDHFPRSSSEEREPVDTGLEDATTPEARDLDGKFPQRAQPHHFRRPDESTLPFSSTPPESPSIASPSASIVGHARRTSSPRLHLYHPFPMRPSQIALPPSPPLPPF